MGLGLLKYPQLAPEKRKFIEYKICSISKQVSQDSGGIHTPGDI